MSTSATVESPSPRTDPVFIGIDVGSTTVKAVVVDPVTHQILWSDYQRHQTKAGPKRSWNCWWPSVTPSAI